MNQPQIQDIRSPPGAITEGAVVALVPVRLEMIDTRKPRVER